MIFPITDVVFELTDSTTIYVSFHNAGSVFDMTDYASQVDLEDAVTAQLASQVRQVVAHGLEVFGEELADSWPYAETGELR